MQRDRTEKSNDPKHPVCATVKKQEFTDGVWTCCVALLIRYVVFNILIHFRFPLGKKLCTSCEMRILRSQFESVMRQKNLEAGKTRVLYKFHVGNM